MQHIIPSDVHNILSKNYKLKMPVFILGGIGISKSEQVKLFAKAAKLELIDIRLSNYEAIDFIGIPYIKDGRTVFAPPKLIPLDGEKIPKGKKGFLVFLDEFMDCSRSIEAASYQLLLDRKIGGKQIHKKVYIVCASNPAGSGGLSRPMSNTVANRVALYTLKPDLTNFLEYAKKVGLPTEIPAYLQKYSETLLSVKPIPGEAITSPRSWTNLGHFINKHPKTITEADVVAYIGNTGRSFYKAYYSNVAVFDISKYINKPERIFKLSTTDSIALISSLALIVKEEKITKKQLRGMLNSMFPEQIASLKSQVTGSTSLELQIIIDSF